MLFNSVQSLNSTWSAWSAFLNSQIWFFQDRSSKNVTFGMHFQLFILNFYIWVVTFCFEQCDAIIQQVLWLLLLLWLFYSQKNFQQFWKCYRTFLFQWTLPLVFFSLISFGIHDRMYLYVYVCMFVHAYLYICMHVCMHLSACMQVCLYLELAHAVTCANQEKWGLGGWWKGKAVWADIARTKL